MRLPNGPVASLVLGLGTCLSAGCAGDAARTPGDAVSGLYGILIDAHVTGAPTPDQLTALAPFLSEELVELLGAAGALRDSAAAADPDEKPPFADGDLFSSLFEGPTSLDVQDPAPDARRLAVRFTRGDEPTVRWTDTVVVAEEGGRLVVDDVVYAGDWDFANRGTLRGTLRSGLEARSADWTLRLDGIGAIRVGMTVREVEALLGGSARIERIEPGDVCAYAYLSSVPEGISFMLAWDTVVRVQVDTPGFHTGAGVGAGSTEASVLERYAGLIRVEPHPYTGPEGHYLIVDDPARPGFRLIFETDGRVVTGFRAGRLPEADLIEGCA